MALPDYFKVEAGTAVIWGQPSATGVTKNLTLNNLATTAAREGVYADLGAQWEQEYYLFAAFESGTAPAAGGLVEVYLPCTHDIAYWPYGVTGADAAYTVANKNNLGAPASLVVAVNTGNVLIGQQANIWIPQGRYVGCVVINNWSQNLRNEGTATDHDSRVILVPRRSLVQDTA